MTALVVIVWIFIALLLCVVTAMRPLRSPHSWFELQRRQDTAALTRETLLSDIRAVRRLVEGLLLILLAVIGSEIWYVWGVIAAAVIWVLSSSLARLSFLHRFASERYLKVEPKLLEILANMPFVGRLLRIDNWRPHNQKLESIEELMHLLESSGHLLSSKERAVITHSVTWHEATIASVMTPVKDIVSIGRGELLGPLTLDDLHKSGYTEVPVIENTIDNVIGFVNVPSLLEINTKRRSEKVEKVMSHQVTYVDRDERLPNALIKVRKYHQHVLIVTDGAGKTVGLVTLSDIIGVLTDS